jgi:hypothetical protein
MDARRAFMMPLPATAVARRVGTHASSMPHKLPIKLPGSGGSLRFTDAWTIAPTTWSM